MTKAEAVKAIQDNWPSEHYTMLREALTIAVKNLEQSHNSDYAKCPKCGTTDVENLGDGSYGCLECNEHFI